MELDIFNKKKEMNDLVQHKEDEFNAVVNGFNEQKLEWENTVKEVNEKENRLNTKLMEVENLKQKLMKQQFEFDLKLEQNKHFFNESDQSK